MVKLIYIFIPIITLLLAACSVNNTTDPVPNSSAEPTPSLEPTKTPAENPLRTSTQLPTSSVDPTPSAESTSLPTEPTEPTSTSNVNSPEEKSGRANADVTFVKAVLVQDGTWTFHVTVAHPDTGWEDYADGWDVVTPEGAVLKVSPDDPFTRLLLHPHENEQPFTRSQSGISIPTGVTQVRVRAHDIVDGFGGQEILVDLEKDSGPGFEIER
jgi:hypothetical protein